MPGQELLPPRTVARSASLDQRNKTTKQAGPPGLPSERGGDSEDIDMSGRCLGSGEVVQDKTAQEVSVHIPVDMCSPMTS